MFKLSDKQKELLKRRSIVVLSTSSLQGNPRSIFVEINSVDDDKVVITDNEMGTTKDNLIENNKVFILAFENDYSYCLKMEGKADYYDKGEYLDFIKGLDSNKGRNPKGVIIVNIKSLVEFK